MTDNGRLEDLNGIHEARIAYTHFWDAGDVEGTASVFADDAIIETAFGNACGKSEIRKFYADHIDGRGMAMHMISNPIIEFTGPDTAKGVWFLTDISIGKAGPGKPPPLLYGTYSDEYRKVDGRWKISRMQLNVLWADH